MATINHYDTHTGRFLQLQVDDSVVDKARHAAQAGEAGALRRAQVIRRCLRLLDSCVAAPEHVIGEAFNAGHAIGSGVASFTELEKAVLDELAELSSEEIMAHNMPLAFGKLIDAILLMKDGTRYEY